MLVPISAAPASQAIASGGANGEKERSHATAAREFEAAFLAEMLTHAGIEDALAQGSGFGGETMASLLVTELAEQIAARGSFGLAEKMRQGLERQA